MYLKEIGLALVTCMGIAHGQTPATAPKFEVASIKPCRENDAETGPGEPKGGRSGGVRTSPERLHLGCETLETLIQFAYLGYAKAKPWAKGVGGFPEPPVSMRLLLQPLKGAPGWVSSEKITIEAKTERPQTEAMMRGPMMRTLLEDRFKLRVHREARDVPVYFLTVAKGGPRLQPAAKGSCIPRGEDGDATYRPGQAPWCGWFRVSPQHDGEDTFGQTMAGLCSQFSGELDRDVIDRTGIRGAFDIHLEMPGDDSSSPNDPFARISSALRGLGLKFESGKGHGEFLVIDHVERPSEN